MRSLRHFFCAVCSPSTIWMPCRNFGSVRFKTVSSKISKECITLEAKEYSATDLWDEIDRTMSDFLAYDGVREWWQTRRHWHTEAFARVVDGIIARGDKPTAYSTYNLKEVAPAKTKPMSETRQWPRIAVVGAGAVGGYFGGMFARAGAPTVFIGRKHFADAVNSKGLVLDKSARPGANQRSRRLLR